MDWLRAYNPDGITLPNIVKPGPPGGSETIYSFDYDSAHFVVINEYYDGRRDAVIPSTDTDLSGDVDDALFAWLEEDLALNSKPIVFIFGHEPAFPLPDEDSGRIRHETDSLNAHMENRDRLWNSLVNHNVTAYFCGHTHNYSTYQFEGVWQINAGHARGTGDTGAPSTFLMIYVMGNSDVWCYTYRLEKDINQYLLAHIIKIN